VSVNDPSRIDIIAVRPSSRAVRLVIADDLAWDDLPAHARLLQEKINTYISFVESGQLARVQSPTIPMAPEVTIVLTVQQQPTEAAESFLSSVGDFLRSVDLRFEVDRRYLSS
jgi:hypothetical protein